MYMGCLHSKEPKQQMKIVRKEHLNDIESIRRAAKNTCVLSDNDWHIDAIKKTWNMTPKSWSHFNCATPSVKETNDYLNLRYKQAIELLEISEKIKIPS